MFNLKLNTKTPSDLQKEIDRVTALLSGKNPEDHDYAQTLDQLTKLHKLKETDSKKRVSADKMAEVAGSLLGIVILISWEHSHAISSKALGFVKKLG